MYLPRNKLTTIPANIGSCTKLQFVYLDENVLTSIPEELAHQSLIILSLNDNLLEALPQQIWQLPILQRLYLRANRFTELPIEVKICRSLRTLDVNYNSMVNPPEAECLKGLPAIVAALGGGARVDSVRAFENEIDAEQDEEDEDDEDEEDFSRYKTPVEINKAERYLK